MVSGVAGVEVADGLGSLQRLVDVALLEPVLLVGAVGPRAGEAVGLELEGARRQLVAYMVAHEYGHQVQDELGLFDRYGSQLPTMAFELQADCFAGTWAHSAYQENRLEQGDVQEALDAALAVGDFDAGNPGHHGTPEQREQAWNTGFESGDPSSCDGYLDPAASA